VTRRFGGLVAVKNVSFSLNAGEITGILGPNGAGKTTLFDVIAGRLRPDSGDVTFDGALVTHLSPHERFERGLLRTFQIAHEFSNLTVLDNLMVVPPRQPGESLFAAWFSTREVSRVEADVREKALRVLDFLKLTPVAYERAGNLSGGQKKLLELGRTMMVDARAVLLDEVAAGVNRTLLKGLAENIQRMNRELGYTFFVIEHDMDLIGQLCDPVIVMAAGRVIAEGPMAEIRSNPEIIEAYLGEQLELSA